MGHAIPLRRYLLSLLIFPCVVTTLSTFRRLSLHTIFLFVYQIIYDEVEKSLFEKKIEKKEGKAYNKQGASKRPNVEVKITEKEPLSFVNWCVEKTVLVSVLV